MEINSAVSPQAQGGTGQAAKVTGPEGGKKPVSLPVIETKAPPKLAEFEPKDVKQAVADLQSFVQGLDRDLSFRLDESIDRSIITVRDANTNQLVRQIPAEEIVEIARDIKESLDAKRAGMLLRGEA